MNLSAFKQSLKKNKYIDEVSRIIAYPYFRKMYTNSDKEVLERSRGVDFPKFSWIKQYKNIHEGERCFVVATGPSLTVKDLNLIQKEISFSMNSAVLALKDTSWCPDYYMIQDEYVFRKLRDKIREASSKELRKIWISESLEKQFGNEESYPVFPLHYLDHKMYHRSGYGEFKFSDDCYATIYDAYTITFSVLQMACYMGFKEIYLLGCDCNYKMPKTHFIEYGHKDPKATIMGDKMIAGHYEFKRFADEHNIKIINCTRGGMLEVYPRMTLEDVLQVRSS